MYLRRWWLIIWRKHGALLANGREVATANQRRPLRTCPPGSRGEARLGHHVGECETARGPMELETSAWEL